MGQYLCQWWHLCPAPAPGGGHGGRGGGRGDRCPQTPTHLHLGNESTMSGSECVRDDQTKVLTQAAKAQA